MFKTQKVAGIGNIPPEDLESDTIAMLKRHLNRHFK